MTLDAGTIDHAIAKVKITIGIAQCNLGNIIQKITSILEVIGLNHNENTGSGGSRRIFRRINCENVNRAVECGLNLGEIESMASLANKTANRNKKNEILLVGIAVALENLADTSEIVTVLLKRLARYQLHKKFLLRHTSDGDGRQVNLVFGRKIHTGNIAKDTGQKIVTCKERELEGNYRFENRCYGGRGKRIDWGITARH